jgi:hypothetical protein
MHIFMALFFTKMHNSGLKMECIGGKIPVLRACEWRHYFSRMPVIDAPVTDIHLIVKITVESLVSEKTNF